MTAFEPMEPEGLRSTAVLEWPPPGLEPIHRRVRHLTSRGWTASLLLCPLLIWLLLDAPGLDPTRGGRTLLALVAFIGILAFLSAIASVAGIIDQARRAQRLGYPTEVIVDVATDEGDHAAAAWLGTSEMADIRQVTRDRTRALRRSAALLAALAAVLPPPLLALGILLAVRGAASLTAVFTIMLLPPLLALITAALLRGYALLLVQWDRGSAQWDPEPVTVQDRAREWIARTRPDAARHPPSGAQLIIVLIAALSGIAIFLFTAFTTAGTVGAGITTRALESAVSMSGLRGESSVFVNLARRERLLPYDTAIDPAAAGIALHAALYGGARRSPTMQPVPHALDVPWRQSPTGPSRAAVREWNATLADSVSPELLADSDHPAVDQALHVARAFTVDVFGARWGDDGPMDLEVLGWQFNNSTRLRRALVVRAARAARAGRYEEAEHTLRALISFGLLLIDNSPAIGDYSAGAFMAREGHAVLGRLRSMRGDSTLQHMLRAVEFAGGSQFGFDRSVQSLDGLRRMAAEGAKPADRWGAAMTLSIAERCGSLRAVLFGPPPRAGFERVLHGALVRFPSEQRLFDLIHDPARHAESLPRLPLPRRWAGTPVIESILGPRHARSLCYALGSF